MSYSWPYTTKGSNGSSVGSLRTRRVCTYGVYETTVGAINTSRSRFFACPVRGVNSQKPTTLQDIPIHTGACLIDPGGLRASDTARQNWHFGCMRQISRQHGEYFMSYDPFWETESNPVLFRDISLDLPARFTGQAGSTL